MVSLILAALMGVWQTVSTGDAFLGFQYGASWLPTFIMVITLFVVGLLSFAGALLLIARETLKGVVPLLFAGLIAIIGFIEYVVTSSAAARIMAATSFETVDWAFVAMTVGVLFVASVIPKFYSKRKKTQ